MAERRMFAKTIIDSDSFLEMPLSTQALLFHLSMRADDEGFVNNPKKILRMIGASEDDFKILVMKQYVIPFDSGIIAIRHWKIHNYIQKDRFKPTIYTEEKSQICEDKNGVYTFCIQDVSKMDTQVSIGKSKDSILLVEDRTGEDSVVATDSSPDPEFSTINDVVKLTEDEITDLIDTMGISMFNEYTDKLATFIKEKDAHIKNHYNTILKWWKEDTAV